MAQGSTTNAVIAVTGDSSPVIIVAARSGYKIVVMGYVLDSPTQAGGFPDSLVATVQFADDSTSPPTLLSGQIGIRAAAPVVAPFASQTTSDQGGWFFTASGANLVLIATGGPVSGHLSYTYMAS